MSIAESPDIWVLQTHAPGDNEQALAVAEALHASFAVKRVDWPAVDPARDRVLLRDFLADGDAADSRRGAAGLRGPWPRLVICCGRRADGIGFWIKAQSGGRTKIVSIGRAHRPVAQYDLLAAPPQFALPERANVVHLKLPPSRARPASGGQGMNAAMGCNMVPVPKPWFTILLGGEAKEFLLAPDELARMARAAQEAVDRHGGSVVVSTSRRTPPALVDVVERALKAPHVYRWSVASGEDNPYDVLLQQSAALFVTPDSASMMLDCAQSGTPTYVAEYPARPDARRMMRLGLYTLFRRLIGRCRAAGLRRAADWLDRAQDVLHARRILRYPRDLNRLQSSIFDLALARRAAEFDPVTLPARASIANDFADLSGLRRLVVRCWAL